MGRKAGTVRILVVDGHPSVVRGLEMLIAETPGFKLVASAACGEEALVGVAAARPDVCLVAIRLPRMDGVATIGALRARYPHAQAIVYSAHGDRRLLSDAIDAGAIGYVLKTAPMTDLVRAIRAVAAGTPFVDPSLAPALVMGTWDEDPPIGERERTVLRLLAEGMHTDQVAAEIGMSREAVKADTRRAVDQLGATGRVHAVATAIRRDLIE